MTLAQVDRRGEASRAAAEGQFALARGDTRVARQKYAEAGRVLEREATAARGPELHLLRFLAASNYYRGGHYATAQKLANRVEERHLPEAVRPLFPPFAREVRRRARPDYAPEVRRRLTSLLIGDRYADVLDALRQHPFLFTPVDLAFLRAAACDSLGEFEASSRFYKLALQYQPDDPELMSSSAAELFQQLERGDLPALERCLAQRLEHLPHAVTYAVACLVRFWLATSGPAPPVGLPEAIQHANTAWTLYQRLPATTARDPNVRESLALALVTAAAVATRLGRSDQAAEFAARATKVDPHKALDFARATQAAAESEGGDRTQLLAKLRPTQRVQRQMRRHLQPA